MIEEIDWNELWKKKTLDASWRKRHKDPVEFFDRKAKWYNKVVLRRTDHGQQTIPKFAVDRDCTVLDIGSGPGTLCIPLAKIAKNITAIDPSKSMLRYLKENAQKEGLKNITSINKKWEDVELGKDIGMHDIVIASHSLVMLDLKKALLKMNEIANRSVYLLASAGKQTWDYHKLWPKFYGEKHASGPPGYIYIVNILYQMGIYANIEIWENESRQCISSLDEAVQERMEYFEQSTPFAEDLIRKHLTRTLLEEEGALWSKRKTRTAMIWWKKKNGRPRGC